MKSERPHESDKLSFLMNGTKGLMFEAEGARSIWEPQGLPNRRSKGRSESDSLVLPYRKK
jgi:hypothetical protein